MSAHCVIVAGLLVSKGSKKRFLVLAISAPRIWYCVCMCVYKQFKNLLQLSKKMNGNATNGTNFTNNFYENVDAIGLDDKQAGESF